MGVYRRPNTNKQRVSKEIYWIFLYRKRILNRITFYLETTNKIIPIRIRAFYHPSFLVFLFLCHFPSSFINIIFPHPFAPFLPLSFIYYPHLLSFVITLLSLLALFAILFFFFFFWDLFQHLLCYLRSRSFSIYFLPLLLFSLVFLLCHLLFSLLSILLL